MCTNEICLSLVSESATKPPIAKGRSLKIQSIEPIEKPTTVHGLAEANNIGLECCAKAGVNKECLGLCRLIADNSSGQASPSACTNDTAKIERCMLESKKGL